MAETMHDRIRQKLTELDLKPRTASLKVSSDPDLFRKVLRPGGSKNPRADTIRMIAEALKVSEDWLINGEGAEKPEATTAPSAPARSRRPRQEPRPDVVESPMVPIMGTAAGSIVSRNIAGMLIEGPVGYVECPPALRTVRDAYAIYVSGDSMSPQHLHGELRFVHPHKPASPGDTVIVQTRRTAHDPGQAYIKRLVQRTGTAVRLQQLNPAATIDIPAEHIEKIHRVLSQNEMFGV